MRSAYALSLLVLAVAACGDDGGNDVQPTLVPGGGVRDPGIEGEVNVYVIDADSDAPIAGATVQIGDKEGVTDADGLFVASGLSGPQTAAIKATGYASSVWIGLDSANLTAALDRTPAPTTPPPQAELAGSITGWETLPAPAAGHVAAAIVTYSQSRELGADDNDLAPPPSGGPIAANVCARGPTGPAPACAWRINSRVGVVRPFAILVDIDQRGTPADDTDDVVTIQNFAIAANNVTVVDGADQSGLALTVLPAGSTTTAQATFGTPPPGLTQTFGIVGVDLGDAGLMQVGTVANASTNIVLPSLSAIPGSTYQLTAIAQEDVSDGTGAQSIVIRRRLASASAIAAGEWLAPATGLSSDRAMVSFGRVAGANAHVIEIDTAPTSGEGTRAMSVIVLDDSATVVLPVAFAPLPTGSLSVSASAFDAGDAFDPREFAIDDLTDVLERLSSETIRLN